MQTDSAVDNYPPQTFHHVLPNMENVITLCKWRDESEPNNKDGRYQKGGEYAKALLNSPNNPELHAIEKERQHKTRENFKTLYGSYVDSHGNEPRIAAEDLLKAVVKHINREFIDAFYKTAKAKFIVVLKQKEHKDLFTNEKNFKERIHDDGIIFRILPRLPKVNDRAGGKRYPNSVFVTMFLPTTISDAAVGNTFMNFGTVHIVYVGTYGESFKEIKNGKRYIRITPFRAKSDLPHEITFQDSPRPFKVMWPEKEIYCKFCGTVHELSHNCEEKAAANKTRPPNVDDSVAVSRKDGINQVDSEFKEPGEMHLILWTH